MKMDENKPYSKEFWSDLYSCEFGYESIKKSEENSGYKYSTCDGDCLIFRKFDICLHEEIIQLAMNFPEKQYLTIPFKLLEGVASEKTLEHIIKNPGQLWLMCGPHCMKWIFFLPR